MRRAARQGKFGFPFCTVDKCYQFRVHIARVRWKRFGVLVVSYSTDHDPRHVHVFEDGKRITKFDIESWVVMEGKLTPRVRKALKALQSEGAFNAKS